MIKNGVRVWGFAALAAIAFGSFAAGCNDSNDNNLLSNPNNQNGNVKKILAPLKMGEDMMPLTTLEKPTTAETNLAPNGDEVPKVAIFHEKVPEYTRYFEAEHELETSYYIEPGDPPTLWCHIPTGSWASYYTTGGMLECPPDSTKLHIYEGPRASETIYGWHIQYGPYKSYYYEPTPYPYPYPDPVPVEDNVWCPVPVIDTIAGTAPTNAGLYIPVGASHIASGGNASSYEKTGLGFDPNLLPPNLQKMRRRN